MFRLGRLDVLPVLALGIRRWPRPARQSRIRAVISQDYRDIPGLTLVDG